MAMKDQEKQLNALLEALGGERPDAGFERRIMRGVEARLQRTDRRIARRPARAWACAAAGAMAFCAVWLFVAMHRGRGSTVPVAVAGVARPAGRTVPVETRVGARQTHLLRTLAVRKPAAVDDAYIASFPAPPAPLTEQERLLLQLARRHDTAEEAMLLPDALRLEEARSQEEYRRFFPPADPAPNEVPPDTALLEARKMIAEANASAAGLQPAPEAGSK
jgi:hypothetical protein